MVLHFLEFWCSSHIDKNAFTSSSVLVHHDLVMYADDDTKTSFGDPWNLLTYNKELSVCSIFLPTVIYKYSI